jgi:molecular chaperone GrpE (heat shock protein)
MQPDAPALEQGIAQAEIARQEAEKARREAEAELAALREQVVDLQTATQERDALRQRAAEYVKSVAVQLLGEDPLAALETEVARLREQLTTVTSERDAMRQRGTAMQRRLQEAEQAVTNARQSALAGFFRALLNGPLESDLSFLFQALQPDFTPEDGHALSLRTLLRKVFNAARDAGLTSFGTIGERLQLRLQDVEADYQSTAEVEYAQTLSFEVVEPGWKVNSTVVRKARVKPVEG